MPCISLRPSHLSRSLAGLAGAGLAAQFPAYYNAYVQNLSGRLEQALIHEARVRDAVARSRLGVDDYLARFTDNADPVIRDGGNLAAAALDDAERLRTALASLGDAGALERPLALLVHLDPGVAADAAERFVPALPFSIEGLVYAAVGLIVANGLWRGLQRLFAALRRRGRPAAAAHHE